MVSRGLSVTIALVTGAISCHYVYRIIAGSMTWSSPFSKLLNQDIKKKLCSKFVSDGSKHVAFEDRIESDIDTKYVYNRLKQFGVQRMILCNRTGSIVIRSEYGTTLSVRIYNSLQGKLIINMNDGSYYRRMDPTDFTIIPLIRALEVRDVEIWGG